MFCTGTPKFAVKGKRNKLFLLSSIFEIIFIFFSIRVPVFYLKILRHVASDNDLWSPEMEFFFIFILYLYQCTGSSNSFLQRIQIVSTDTGTVPVNLKT
jgi:hypothetical protein